LPSRYRTFLESLSILAMRYESAELAKISVNFYFVASVSAANTLVEVSETIGADRSAIWRRCGSTSASVRTPQSRAGRRRGQP
jgi:UDP-glucose 6-dehydrogenase